MILTRGFLVLFYFLAIVVGNANADWDLDKIIKEADQGDAYAQYNLANGYFNGYWGIEQNYKKAVELYKKAAEQGHPLATFKLGEIYANGKGVQKDHIEAAEWYKKAAKIYIKEAEQGDVYSQVQLGDMYYKGLGLSRDYSEALKWYSKASKQGYADGQGRIGRMYLDGNGVPPRYCLCVCLV